MPRRPGTVSVVLVRALVEAAKRAKIAHDALLETLGVDPRILGDPDATIPGGVLLRGWDVAAKMSNDGAFGLHAGEAAPVGIFDVLDYAMLSARSLREALDRTTRYYRIISDNAEMRLESSGNLARLVYRARVADEPWRHATECFFAVSMVRARAVLGPDWSARELHFAHPKPDDVSDHERLFRAPLVFDHPTSEILFDAGVLDRPLASADPALGSVVVRYAEELVARIPPEEDAVEKTRELVKALLRGGEPALDDVATTMGMSARTLQRKLTGAGTSFAKVLDQVRHELALTHLEDPKIALGEIAFLLGFAQPNAFHRAFRRWTGKSPAAYRAESKVAARSK